MVSKRTQPAADRFFKPTKRQLIEAAGKTVPDVIAPGLRVLFCGINPGLYTAAVGHHFARPGNRFWPVLHASGFTDRLLSPFDEQELLRLRLGVTNVAARATAAASELTRDDFVKGGHILRSKARRYHPRIVAVLESARTARRLRNRKLLSVSRKNRLARRGSGFSQILAG